jgi:hypothetical protein
MERLERHTGQPIRDAVTVKRGALAALFHAHETENGDRPQTLLI